ncbi:MAG: tRNA (guanosine(37)-N1)-methyltransferase TrmD [Fibrobacteria bacterium]|nr:tRNA (guanosine(37)-N1)-methyltransferase TrmD [Fibrobacteria bacterium]
MQIDIITLFPRMFSALNESITGRAQLNRFVQLHCHNLRDYTSDKHRTVDDSPFGGEAGMVLKPEPLKAAIHAVKQSGNPHTVFLTPQGKVFSQKRAIELAKKRNILIICGHYKGIDERIRQNYVDEEISIGDFVMTGGELPAMCLVDSIIRLIPGVLGDTDSAKTDSFYSENKLGWPVYTRPETFDGATVPKVLLSGHHKNILKWQVRAGLLRTKQNRPELFEKLNLTKEETKLLAQEDFN